jgi:prepilin-type N-terminal cleavage/methylation domain-containing protein
MARAQIRRGQDGFTLIEVMAAAMVLVIGMLAILTVLQKGLEKTTLNRQRTTATNLAREITEAARTVTYSQLTTGQAAGALQALKPELVSTSAGTWTLKRGATTYTITASACAFDDPADKIASVPPANKCANNPGGVTGDTNGDDFRRLTLDLSWNELNKTTKVQTIRQTTLIVNPSGGIGPRISSFPNAPDVTSGSSVTFNVVTTPSDAVHWNADDAISEGNAVGGPTNWTITWNLKSVNASDAVLDGTYTVTAQALDDRGVVGDTKLATVTVNRTAPLQVKSLAGGHDTRDGDWVDLQWSVNAERDITGYAVFWAGPDDNVGTADDQRVCPATVSPTKLGNNATTCQHLTPPPGATKYYIHAYDATQQSPPTVLNVQSPTPQPESPGTLTVTGLEDPILAWTAPAAAAPAFYRIYRDGTSLADRFSRTGDLTFEDVSAETPHQYWVTAVDADYNESLPVGPVAWSP